MTDVPTRTTGLIVPGSNTCNSAIASFGMQPKQEPVTNLASYENVPAAPTTIFNSLQPYLYETDEAVREVRDYKQLTRQFLESTGVVQIGPFPAGIELVDVYVSGPDSYKCITDVILMCNNLTLGCSSPDGVILIDTGRTNDYTGGDISPGFQKLFQVTYITNDITFQEKKTTTSTKFAETVVTVQGRDTVMPDGTCKAVSFTTADQLFSGVYAINQKNVADDSGGTYATPVKGPDAVEIIDTATTNRHPSAVDGGIGCVNVDGTTGNCK